MNSVRCFAADGADLSALCASCQHTLSRHSTRRLSFLGSGEDQEGRDECHMCVQLRYRYESGAEIREVRVPMKTRGQIVLGPFQSPMIASDTGYFWRPSLRSLRISRIFSRRVSLCALYVINAYGQIALLSK
jgi:hypothetical protein